MEKPDRLRLLKVRFQHIAGGNQWRSLGKKRKQPRPVYTKHSGGFRQVPGFRHNVVWITLADEPRKVQLRTKRTARVSPLTKIAEQLPLKLPRVPLPQ